MSNNQKKDKNHYLGLGIGFGLITGSAMGVLFTSVFNGIETGRIFAIPIGAALGMLVGIVVGTLIDSNNRNE